MSLVASHPRSVYRVYDAEEYLTGAASPDDADGVRSGPMRSGAVAVGIVLATLAAGLILGAADAMRGAVRAHRGMPSPARLAAAVSPRTVPARAGGPPLARAVPTRPITIDSGPRRVDRPGRSVAAPSRRRRRARPQTATVAGTSPRPSVPAPAARVALAVPSAPLPAPAPAALAPRRAAVSPSASPSSEAQFGFERMAR